MNTPLAIKNLIYKDFYVNSILSTIDPPQLLGSFPNAHTPIIGPLPKLIGNVEYVINYQAVEFWRKRNFI